MARKYAPCVKNKAKDSKYSADTLQKVYNRGIGAWKTNPSSVRSRSNPSQRNVPRSQRFSKEAWACARVNAFVAGRERVDPDLRRPNTRKFNSKTYSKIQVLPNLNSNQRRILSQRVQKLRANGINIRTVGWANGEIGVYARRATRKPSFVYNKRETRKPRRKGSPLKRQADSIRKLARTRNLNERIQSDTADRELTDLELFMQDYGYGEMDFDPDNEDMLADWEEFLADLDSEYSPVDIAIAKNEKDSDARALFGLRSGGGVDEIVRWAVGENIIETGMNPSNRLNDAKLIMTEEEFERLDFSTPEAPRYSPSQQGIVGAELPDANMITMLSIPEYVALPVITVRSSDSPWSDNPDAWNMKGAFRLDDTLLTATKELDDVFATGQADYSQTEYPGEVAFLNAIAAKAPYAIEVAKQGRGRQRLNANDEDIEEEAERLSLYRDNEITVVAIDTAVFSGRRGDFEGIRITPDNELEFDGDGGYYIDGEWVSEDEVLDEDAGYLEKYGTNFADQLTNQISENRGWGDRREWKDGLAQLWFRGVKLREKEPGDYDDPNFANQFNFAINEWGESNIPNWLEIYGGSPHLLTEVELEEEWNPDYHGIWQSEVIEELTERGINFTEAGRRYRSDGSIETPAEAKERFENMLDKDGDSIKGFLRGSRVNWEDVPDEDISLEIERRKWQMRG